MFKVNIVYLILLYLFLVQNIVHGYKPFWINPCGYFISNSDDLDENDDASITKRILILAELN